MPEKPRPCAERDNAGPFYGFAARLFDYFKSILEAVDKHFGITSAEGKRFSQAAFFADFRPNSTKDQIGDQVQANVAHSKDLMEEAISALRQRILEIKGEPVLVKLNEAAESASADKPKAEPDVIIWKLTWFGMGIDLKAAWHRMQKWLGKK